MPLQQKAPRWQGRRIDILLAVTVFVLAVCGLLRGQSLKHRTWPGTVA